MKRGSREAVKIEIWKVRSKEVGKVRGEGAWTLFKLIGFIGFIKLVGLKMKKEDFFKQTYRSTDRREIFARVRSGRSFSASY